MESWSSGSWEWSGESSGELGEHGEHWVDSKAQSSQLDCMPFHVSWHDWSVVVFHSRCQRGHRLRSSGSSCCLSCNRLELLRGDVIRLPAEPELNPLKEGVEEEQVTELRGKESHCFLCVLNFPENV